MTQHPTDSSTMSAASGDPGPGIAAIRVGVGAAIAIGYVYTFPGRPDYAAHFLAFYGAALVLLGAAIGFIRGPIPAWAAAVGLALLAAGTVTEATVFRSARFDPVDWTNQSLGIVLGILTPAWRSPRRCTRHLVVIVAAGIVAIGAAVVVPR